MQGQNERTALFYWRFIKSMAKYIHGTSREEQARLAILNQLLNDRCLERISLNRNDRILDIGCGLGIFSRILSELVPDGKVVGIEKEMDQINRGYELAKNTLQDHAPDIRQGSAYQLPLDVQEWASFHLAFIRFLLEHLGEPDKAVTEVYKALAIDGRIILIDDDHANFRITPEQPAFDRLWSAYCQVYEQQGNDPYIGRRLISLLRQAGFRNLKIDFVLFGATADEPDFTHYANNLLGILNGAEEEISQIYRDPHHFDQDIQAIKDWANLPDATLWYAANWAEGKK